MLVTIVVATLGRTHLLERAIRSVLRQTHEDYELILVDDGSPDGQMLSRLVDSWKDSRIRLIRRSVNGGPAAARNAAIFQAQGELVAFLDDDDEFYPTSVQLMVEAWSRCGSDYTFCWGDWDQVTDGSYPQRRIRMRWAPDPTRLAQGLVLACMGNPTLPTGALVVPTSLIRRIGGFDENLRAAVDTDLLLRLVDLATPVPIPHSLFVMHQHGAPRVSNPGLRRAEALERIMSKHEERLRGDSGLRATWHLRVAWHYAHGHAMWKARHQALRAVLSQPRNPEALGSLAAMLLSPKSSIRVRWASKEVRKWGSRLCRPRR